MARIEGRVQIAMMLAIGGAAAAASFTHVHDVAVKHGQAEWIGWADAIVLELMSIAAGLDARRRRRRAHPVGVPVTILSVSVAFSLAAQVETAESSPQGWIAAALPALGFLAMVKIALSQHPGPAPGGHGGTGPRRDPGPRPDGPGPRAGGPDGPGRHADGPGPEHAGPGRERDGPGPRTVTMDGPGPQLTFGPGPGPCTDRAPPASTRAEAPAGSASSDPALLAAAVEAAARLEGSGQQVTRNNLAAEMRRGGHALSNAALTGLLRALRYGQTTGSGGQETARAGQPAVPPATQDPA